MCNDSHTCPTTEHTLFDIWNLDGGPHRGAQGHEGVRIVRPERSGCGSWGTVFHHCVMYDTLNVIRETVQPPSMPHPGCASGMLTQYYMHWRFSVAVPVVGTGPCAILEGATPSWVAHRNTVHTLVGPL